MMLGKAIFTLLLATLGIQLAMAQDVAEQLTSAISNVTGQANITFVFAFVACLIAALAVHFCCCCSSNDSVIKISIPFLRDLLGSSLSDSGAMVIQGSHKATKSEFTLHFKKFKEDERTGSRHQPNLLVKDESHLSNDLIYDGLTDADLIGRKKVSDLSSTQSQPENGSTTEKVPRDAESTPAQDASLPDGKPSIVELLIPAFTEKKLVEKDQEEAPLHGHSHYEEMPDVRSPSGSSSKFSETAPLHGNDEKEKQMPDESKIWLSKDQGKALHGNGPNDKEMPIPVPRRQPGSSSQYSDKVTWHELKDKSRKSSGSHKTYLWPPQPRQYRCVKEIIITAFITISVTAALSIGSIALYNHWSS